MTTEELKIKLSEIAPSITYEEGGEMLNLFIEASEFKEFAQVIFNDDNLAFDYMFCLTCVDWKTHLTMVYHLESTKHRHIIVIKSKLDRENPEIETVCDIWRTAELLEREVYELFGVRFLNHPDLRRLLLTDDFEGWPLRKDFEDEVNMIKL